MLDAVTKEIKIERIAFGGDGIGHLDGKVCFVPGTASGENVRIKVTEDKKNFCRARLEEIVTPSSARIKAVCPLAENGCPGCVYQHLDYAEEIRTKQTQLGELLLRMAGIDPVSVLRPPLPSPRAYGYRNKLTLHAQIGETGMKLGYFMADNRTVINLPECPLAEPAINKLLKAELANTDFRSGLTDGMNVTLRWTEADGPLCWRDRPPELQQPLRENTPCGEMLVPAGSFFQINNTAAGLLMSTVKDILEKIQPECFIDLYCGVGFFSRAAVAAGIKQLIGVESDPPAVKTATRNLKPFPAVSGRFLTGKVEKTLASLSQQELPERTALLVDPPRGGLDPEALRRMALLKIPDLLYVSCSPDTLCRDLKSLVKAGYALKSAQLVDMFPRTAHFETVTWLNYNGQRTP